MEFSKEFVEENQLNEQQVSAIKQEVSNRMTTELGEKVHEHTEKSLSGVWKTVETLTGIEREKGEKYADALSRASGLYFEGTKSDLERQKTELQEKLKNNKGDEVLKQQLEEKENQIKALKPKAAEFDDWAKNDYKGKYEKTSETLSVMQKKIAFNSVLPTKPNNVNEYEWKAKWNDFENGILENNDIVLDDQNNAWAVDRENDAKRKKLGDLVKQDKNIQDLLKGRQQNGLGSQPKTVKIDGLPFNIKENATSEERNMAIKEYLANEGVGLMHKDYTKRFAEYNQIAMGLGKKPAD